MIKFRQKDFTIPEGHYTGPKDIDKVPGVLEMVGKSALGGAGIGAVVGAIMKDSSALSGAITGAKYGGLTGLVLKFFLNYLHNPMTRIKFQDIDRNIRREFGIYQLQGITVGDTVSKRATMDEKFSTNDRNVSNYKINFAIQDNQVIMYTLGMTDKELEKTSNILDYYCKKYHGMEYTATPINVKVNSYSVMIVFTNYQVISNFMMELSSELQCKINLLDNKAIVDRRINEAANLKNDEVEEEKQSSVGDFVGFLLVGVGLIASWVISVISFLFLLIFSRIIFAIIKKVIFGFVSLPFIRTIDQVLGMVFSVIKCLLLISIILIVLSVFMGSGLNDLLKPDGTSSLINKLLEVIMNLPFITKFLGGIVA